MSDHDEPQSFQNALWDPDLIAREKWCEAICRSSRRCWTWVFGDMSIEKTVHKTEDWLGVDGYLR